MALIVFKSVLPGKRDECVGFGITFSSVLDMFTLLMLLLQLKKIIKKKGK
jgi:hypothetical protein